MPRYEDLDWTGMKDFSWERFAQLMTVDRAAWMKECLAHEELFTKLFDRLPKEFICERELLLSRLWRSPEKWELRDQAQE
jgi:phosphoenolpyruvate carboxykinase (GTP)